MTSEPDPRTPPWFEVAKPVLPVILNVTVTALFHLLLRSPRRWRTWCC